MQNDKFIMGTEQLPLLNSQYAAKGNVAVVEKL